MERYISKIRSI